MVEEKKYMEIKASLTKGKKASDLYKWKQVDSKIEDTNGNIIFQQSSEVPSDWSELATRVVSSKYLYKGDEHLENSVKDLAYRVSNTIADEAVRQGVISKKLRNIKAEETAALTMGQYGSFNSPVWFNVGLNKAYGVSEKRDSGASSHWALDFKTGEFTNDIDAYVRPQASACFIQSIQDNLEAILGHGVKEGMLFKYGSGTGTNFSNLRGINEPLSGGGVASGMPSFMRIFDIIAGRIQSGGKTRRAAKMVINNVDHPDIFRFINWKVNEERKALWLCGNPEWAPEDGSDMDSEAYKTVDGQNGNNSIRVSDEFMKAVETNAEWDLKYITGDRVEEEIEIPLKDYKDDRQLPDKRFIKRTTNKRKVVAAREVWEQIARAAYVSGDPAIQYDGNINKWHTCINDGRINASNPCSEFMFLDNSACNLASLNLMKFVDKSGDFNVPLFKHAVRSFIMDQDTLVDLASYPSKEAAMNSHKYRPLGLGYTNLGALCMANGIAYNSDQARAIAGAVTSLMTATAYETSADLAKTLGPFERFEANKEPMMEVMDMHQEAFNKIDKSLLPRFIEKIVPEARKSWKRVKTKGNDDGFRNAQVSLLAPTGTIGFMMDVDCTGIEPMIAIADEKGLAGGGKIVRREVNTCVKQGLGAIGFKDKKLENILEYIEKKGTVLGAPGLDKEQYPIFATALGDNTISVDGHMYMMAAVQPHLSGAISKTVNLPKGSSLEEIKDTYQKGHELGLKSISLYVDGSKGIQPVNVIKNNEEKEERKWGERKKPQNPTERYGVNVDIGNTGVHVIVGEYGDRKPSESIADMFVTFGSSGSNQSAAYTSWSKEASRGLQQGATIESFIKHNRGASGIIDGSTNHPHIKMCSSIEDFVAKWIMLEYMGETEHCQNKPKPEEIENLRCNVLARRNRIEHYRSRIKFIDKIMQEGEVTTIKPLLEDDGTNGSVKPGDKFCKICGFPTVASGANCHKCMNCGDAAECG